MSGSDDPLPPPPPLPSFAPSPAPPPSDHSGLGLVAGLLATALLCAGLVTVWPDDDAATGVRTTADAFANFGTTVPGATGEPSQGGLFGDIENGGTQPGGPAVSLFAGGATDAVAAVLAEAGQPSQFIEMVLYPTYTFVAYRDPAQPDHIDERMWRDGQVGDARPHPIDDRVDADTEPGLFTLEGLDLSVVPGLVADASTRYDVPVEVTHIIIDRFLPFDQRVLIRVYASPSDGRSGGGYVSYDTAGTFVKVCC